MSSNPTSKKDVWLIPKRSNFYQIIGFVEAILNEGLSGRVWNASKQETIATRLRQKGLTNNRSFSHQSARTLFAGGPKFLGFAYTDSDIEDSNTRGSKVFITKAGQRLAGENLLQTGEVYSNLGDWEKNHSVKESNLIKIQLLKLILNNPITSNGGQVLVYPFLSTLKLCKELGYLDFEEIAYIVFSMRSEDEYELLKQRIINFRSLDAEHRKNEIDAYAKTEAGQISMVKAPFANYFIAFCTSSGLFLKSDIEIENYKKLTVLKVRDETLVNDLSPALTNNIYNFRGNKKLWVEYYGDPDIDRPPKDINLNISISEPGHYYVEILNEGQLKEVLTIEGSKIEAPLTVFRGKKYDVKVNYIGAQKTLDESFVVSDDTESVDIKFSVSKGESLDGVSLDTQDEIVKAITSLSSSHQHMDEGFYSFLKLREKLEGKNFINNNVRGGRLEYLFFRLLSILYDNGVVDYVKWYGHITKDGLPRPAPGGKQGNPDVVFAIGETSVALELTTIMGTAAQWSSSEAASVPDHINTYSEMGNTEKTIGVFSAPTINPRVKANFDAHTSTTGVPIVCIDLINLSKLLAENDKDAIIHKLMSYSA